MTNQLVLPGVAEPDRRQRKHRLLVCYTCSTIEKLPPYEGREDENGVYLDYDAPLEHLIQTKHSRPELHIGRLFQVDEGAWESMETRQQINKELFGLEAEKVAWKDTFSEDAGKCYNRHHRPKQGCIDWRDDSKRLGSPSGSAASRPVFLCDFCPVKSYVETEVRWKRGDYK